MAVSSRIGNRRKAITLQLSGQVEACEMRALLSAAPVAGIVEAVEAPIDSPSNDTPVPDGMEQTEGGSPGNDQFDGIDYPSAEGWYPAAPPEWWILRQESVVPEDNDNATVSASGPIVEQLPCPEGWTEEQWQA